MNLRYPSRQFGARSPGMTMSSARCQVDLMLAAPSSSASVKLSASALCTVAAQYLRDGVAQSSSSSATKYQSRCSSVVSIADGRKGLGLGRAGGVTPGRDSNRVLPRCGDHANMPLLCLRFHRPSASPSPVPYRELCRGRTARKFSPESLRPFPTGILDFQHDPVLVFRIFFALRRLRGIAREDSQAAALRMAPVNHGQVHDYLLDLRGIGQNPRCAASCRNVNQYRCRANAAA